MQRDFSFSFFTNLGAPYVEIKGRVTLEPFAILYFIKVNCVSFPYCTTPEDDNI